MALFCFSRVESGSHRMDTYVAGEKVQSVAIHTCLRLLRLRLGDVASGPYVAVLSGIVYLILLNGLRWMRVSARQHVVWLKLLRGTLASIVCMFFVRLFVVPGNTFPLTGPRRRRIFPAIEISRASWMPSQGSNW